MMMSDNNFENIERYIHNEFSSEERKIFEARLEKEEDLRKQYEAYEEVETTLTKRFDWTEREQALKALLEKENSRYFARDSIIQPLKKKRKSIWLSVISVAAAAILVLLLWSPWQHNLLNRYGQIEMTNPTVRGNEQNRRMTEAARLFNSEDYQEALSLLDSAVRAHPENAQSLFYRGVTLLHLKKEKEAQDDLKAVYEGASVYRYQAAYFMGLSYLQQEKNDSCRHWLQKIPSEASIFKKAKKVLQRLEK